MPVSFRLLAVILIGVCITSMLPVIAAISIARQQADDNRAHYALDLAHSALLHTEETGDQLRKAAAVVGPLTRASACTPAGLDVMRTVDLGSPMLQGVGWVEGNSMVCSSFAGKRAFALGPPDYVSPIGSQLRTRVPFIDPDSRYLVVQFGHTAGVVHKDLALSFLGDVPGLGTAVFSWSRRAPLTARGAVPARYLKIAYSRDTVLHDGQRTLALVKSNRFDLGALVVLDEDRAAILTGDAARTWLPIGILGGAVLSAIFVYVVRSRSSMAMLIRAALNDRKFRLVYQPVIELGSGRVMGVEGLLRWDRGTRIPIPPDVFIPVAEEAGVISDLTRRAFDILAADWAAILKAAPGCEFAMNISATDLHRPELLEELTQWSAKAGLPLSSLALEATERGLVDVDKAGELLRHLRGAGVRIAIDDFGTGYSSLAYLALLEVDYVKIDRLFVQALGTSAATSQVASRIIEMAKDLGLKTIAEGIETQQQDDQVRALGVDYAQGFYYARPMPVAQLLDWLRDPNARKGGRTA